MVIEINELGIEDLQQPYVLSPLSLVHCCDITKSIMNNEMTTQNEQDSKRGKLELYHISQKSILFTSDRVSLLL
jgi:hypothetical protein